MVSLVIVSTNAPKSVIGLHTLRVIAVGNRVTLRAIATNRVTWAMHLLVVLALLAVDQPVRLMQNTTTSWRNCMVVFPLPPLRLLLPLLLRDQLRTLLFLLAPHPVVLLLKAVVSSVRSHLGVNRKCGTHPVNLVLVERHAVMAGVAKGTKVARMTNQRNSGINTLNLNRLGLVQPVQLGRLVSMLRQPLGLLMAKWIIPSNGLSTMLLKVMPRQQQPLRHQMLVLRLLHLLKVVETTRKHGPSTTANKVTLFDRNHKVISEYARPEDGRGCLKRLGCDLCANLCRLHSFFYLFDICLSPLVSVLVLVVPIIPLVPA